MCKKCRKTENVAKCDVNFHFFPTNCFCSQKNEKVVISCVIISRGNLVKTETPYKWPQII